jgi:hypothetical protein
VDLLSLDDDNAEEEVSPFSPGISRNTTKLTAAETVDARKKHVAFSRLASGWVDSFGVPYSALLT